MDAAIRAWLEHQLAARVIEAHAFTGGVTSTILGLTDATGRRSVLRMMTEEPWRRHGRDLTLRERAAQRTLLAAPDVPAPRSIAVDAEGEVAGVALHLMSRRPGDPLAATAAIGEVQLAAMADLLARIHAVTPDEPYRTFQSWAWPAKRVVPPWTRVPASWERAFALLDAPAPAYEPHFLHRDFSHRNLLWNGDPTTGTISGVVDWVEASTGPAWLDAAHAATTLAVHLGPTPARAFLTAYARLSEEPLDAHWLVMDAVGFLPPPGREPLFAHPDQLARLDAWLHEVVTGVTGVAVHAG
ncbi:phosphotransferase family protein [Nocardioides sp.]|uniref:phosphotransferase family protein n=1 Tax=Nocardioides sp. TaxID=35761 RepID=UPI003518EB0C